LKFETALFEMSAGIPNQLPAPVIPEIVFSGRSNVGKSSLMNKLLNRKALARVSAVPGKTATVNFYRLGDTVRLVDLPGYGYAKVSQSEKDRWAGLVHGYFEGDRDIRLVVQLIDMRHPPTSDDIKMIDYMTDNEIPFIIALTKADKLNKSGREQRLKALESELYDYIGVKIIPFSSKSGEGVGELRSVLSAAVKG